MMKKSTERKLEKQDIERIERVLAKDERVELIPVKDGVRIVRVKRENI